MDRNRRDSLDQDALESVKLVVCRNNPGPIVGTSGSKGWEAKNEDEREEGKEEVEEVANQRKEDKPYLVVPDGGWGWLVAFGGFIITMLLSSLGPCFGLLFSRYLLELGASSAMIAWIFNTQLFIWHLVGPLVRPLSNEFGWRPLGMFGVLLCSLSIIISAFSPSAGFLFFSFSLLSGVGGGLVVSMCYIVIPQYFDRRRGLANAIMMVGLCMGQILGAPFIRYLQDHHGFLGAALILGAVMLNGCVGASFFHPVEWHMKKVNVEEEEEEVTLPEAELRIVISSKRNKMENGSKVARPFLGENQDSNDYDKEFIVVSGGSETHEEAKEISGFIRTSNRESEDSPTSGDVTQKLNDSSSTSISGQRMNETHSRKQKTRGPSKLFRILVRVVQSTISDLKILRSRRSLIIALSNMLCMNAYFNFVMMVPFAMQAADLTLQDSAWCIMVMGIFNLLSRIIISIMSDWPRFNMRLCCMIGYAVLASVMFAFPLIKEVKWLMVVMGIFGCGLAATISLLHLVMIQYMGMENLAVTFGSTCLLIGFGFPTFGPLIGLIRDYSGSYALSMWILSAMTSSAFILWIFMPAAVTYDNRVKMKMKKKKKKDKAADQATEITPMT